MDRWWKRPTTASSMIVMIISSTSKPNAFCSVGQISGPVVLRPPIFMASPSNMNFANIKALTMAMPQGANSMPWVCSTAVFIKITAPMVT